MDREPLVVGLVGSVCAGKSVVADELERLGARVYRADEYVHVLFRRPDVIREMVDAFGDSIRAPDGSIDRARLGHLVFNDRETLKRLESMIHPRAAAHADAIIERTRRRRDAPLVVLDAPLLLEAGRGDVPDRLLVVDAPRERRVAWAAESRGWDAREMERREARLIPLAEKRRRADAFLDNDGTESDLLEKVRTLWKEWV